MALAMESARSSVYMNASRSVLFGFCFLIKSSVPYFNHGFSFVPGHTITVEPGFYDEANGFGVRTESLVVCKEVKVSHSISAMMLVNNARVDKIRLWRFSLARLGTYHPSAHTDENDRLVTDGQIRYRVDQ